MITLWLRAWVWLQSSLTQFHCDLQGGVCRSQSNCIIKVVRMKSHETLCLLTQSASRCRYGEPRLCHGYGFAPGISSDASSMLNLIFKKVKAFEFGMAASASRLWRWFCNVVSFCFGARVWSCNFCCCCAYLYCTLQIAVEWLHQYFLLLRLYLLSSFAAEKKCAVPNTTYI